MEALRIIRDDGTVPDDSQETFTAPSVLFRAKQPAVALLYGWLYDRTLAQGKTTIDTSVSAIMEIFDRDRRTVDGWLATLAKKPWEAIDVSQDRLTGELRIAVYRLRAFEPRRVTKVETARPLIDEPTRNNENREEAVYSDHRRAPLEERRSQPRPADASGDGRSGDFVQIPPRRTGEFAQNPPSEVSQLAEKIEAKRRQRLAEDRRAAGEFAQNPPLNLDLKFPVKDTLRKFQISASGVPNAEAATAYQADLTRLAKVLINRVPGLTRAPAYRVAKACLAGWLDFEREVEPALISTEQAVADGRAEEAWHYFVGAMRNQFAQHGQHWPRRKESQRKPR